MSDYDDTWRERLNATLDDARPKAIARRKKNGYRTARENVDDLCDDGSFAEYGQLAVAAQRSRKSPEQLREETAADGILPGKATINADLVGADAACAAIIVNDYTVLAGSQGFFHHRKLDRILDVASRNNLPVVMYTEGGGGRPG